MNNYCVLVQELRTHSTSPLDSGGSTAESCMSDSLSSYNTEDESLRSRMVPPRFLSSSTDGQPMGDHRHGRGVLNVDFTQGTLYINWMDDGSHIGFNRILILCSLEGGGGGGYFVWNYKCMITEYHINCKWLLLHHVKAISFSNIFKLNLAFIDKTRFIGQPSRKLTHLVSASSLTVQSLPCPDDFVPKYILKHFHTCE